MKTLDQEYLSNTIRWTGLPKWKRSTKNTELQQPRNRNPRATQQRRAKVAMLNIQRANISVNRASSQLATTSLFLSKISATKDLQKRQLLKKRKETSDSILI